MSQERKNSEKVHLLNLIYYLRYESKNKEIQFKEKRDQCQMIYLVLFLFEAIVCYYYDAKQLNQKKIFEIQQNKLRISVVKGAFVILIMFPLWFVMGLRYNVGVDYREYESIFRISVLYKKNIYHIEWGYYLLNRIAGSITQNPQIIFFIVAFLIVFFFFKGIETNNGSMYYGVLSFMGLGYYFYAMNGQRQYIAIMIMFFALQFLEKKQIRQYLICVLVATFFHFSAIVWIPIYFAINYIPTNMFYWGSFGMAIAANRLRSSVLNLLANIGFYTGQIEGNMHFFRTHFSLVNVVMSGFFLLCGAIFYRQFKEKRKNVIWLQMVWLIFLIYGLLYEFGNAGTRIASYMCIAYFLLIPEFILCLNRSSRKWGRVLVTIILSILMLSVLTYSGNENQAFIPYKYRMLWE